MPQSKRSVVEMKPADDALGSLDHLERGIQDFRSDSVTWVKCDSIGFHITVRVVSLGQPHKGEPYGSRFAVLPRKLTSFCWTS